MTEQTIETTPMPNGLAKETSLLIDLLKDGKPGDVLTDETMTAACGKSTECSGDGYGNLETAKKHVLSHHGVVWYRIRGAGVIKCADAKEIGYDSKRTIKAVSRKSKQVLKRIATVDLTNVADDDKTEFLATAATLGTLALFSKSTTVKKLIARNVTATPELPDMLGMFK